MKRKLNTQCTHENLFNGFITFAISSIITLCIEKKGCKTKVVVECRIYFTSSTYFIHFQQKKNKEANVEFIFIFKVKIKPFFSTLLSNCADRSHGNEFLGVYIEWGKCWPALATQPKDTEKKKSMSTLCSNIHIVDVVILSAFVAFIRRPTYRSEP